jgi:hypothetical protein
MRIVPGGWANQSAPPVFVGRTYPLQEVADDRSGAELHVGVAHVRDDVTHADAVRLLRSRSHHLIPSDQRGGA